MQLNKIMVINNQYIIKAKGEFINLTKQRFCLLFLAGLVSKQRAIPRENSADFLCIQHSAAEFHSIWPLAVQHGEWSMLGQENSRMLGVVVLWLENNSFSPKAVEKCIGSKLLNCGWHANMTLCCKAKFVQCLCVCLQLCAFVCLSQIHCTKHILERECGIKEATKVKRKRGRCLSWRVLLYPPPTFACVGRSSEGTIWWTDHTFI